MTMIHFFEVRIIPASLAILNINFLVRTPHKLLGSSDMKRQFCLLIMKARLLKQGCFIQKVTRCISGE